MIASLTDFVSQHCSGLCTVRQACAVVKQHYPHVIAVDVDLELTDSLSRYACCGLDRNTRHPSLHVSAAALPVVLQTGPSRVCRSQLVPLTADQAVLEPVLDLGVREGDANKLSKPVSGGGGTAAS